MSNYESALQQTLAPEYIYDVPKKLVASKRQTTYFKANTSSVEDGRSISIDIPAVDQFLATDAAHLKFLVRAPSANFHLPACGGSGLIEMIRIYHKGTGQLIDEIYEYNVLYATLHSLTVPDHVAQGPLSVLHGTATTRDPFAVGSDYKNIPSDGRMVMVPLKHTILSAHKYLPLKLTTGLRVEVTFAEARKCLVVPVGTTEEVRYSVEDPELVCDLIKMNDKQTEAFDAAFAQSGLRIATTCWAHHLRSWPASTQSVQFGSRMASIKTVMVVPRKFVSTYGKDNLRSRYGRMKSYQWELGGTHIPVKAVDSHTKAFAEVVTAMHGSVSGADTARYTQDTTDSGFVIMRELESSKHLISGDPTLKQKNIDLVLNLVANEGAPEARLDCFLEYDKLIQFNRDGSLEVLQ